jgi:hypothetical protein
MLRIRANSQIVILLATMVLLSSCRGQYLSGTYIGYGYFSKYEYKFDENGGFETIVAGCLSRDTNIGKYKFYGHKLKLYYENSDTMLTRIQREYLVENSDSIFISFKIYDIRTNQPLEGVRIIPQFGDNNITLDGQVLWSPGTKRTNNSGESVLKFSKQDRSNSVIVNWGLNAHQEISFVQDSSQRISIWFAYKRFGRKENGEQEKLYCRILKDGKLIIKDNPFRKGIVFNKVNAR